MIENLITMVKMIAFCHQLSKESGYKVGVRKKIPEGVSPAQAMQILFMKG